MPETLQDPETARVLALQRAMASLAFTPGEPTSLREFARAQGLERADQEAFRRQEARLLAYRSFIRGTLAEPLEEALPVTLSLLEGAGCWEACQGAFLASRAARSPYYRDIAPTFLGWLAERGWGRERWPFLLELVHCELLQPLVARHPESPPPPGLHPAPRPEDVVVLDSAAQVVSYAHGVHLSTPQAPVPPPGPVHLLVHRHQDRAHWRTLTQATAALLVEARIRPLGAVVQALGLPSQEAAFSLLEALREAGAILGFRPPGGDS